MDNIINILYASVINEFIFIIRTVIFIIRTCIYNIYIVIPFSIQSFTAFSALSSGWAFVFLVNAVRIFSTLNSDSSI